MRSPTSERAMAGLPLEQPADEGGSPDELVEEGGSPDELVEALDADPALADARHRLTPGPRRSSAIALNGAENPEARIARRARFRV